MSSHVITPGPYRATKLWNEVTRLFRAGMPVKKHRQNFRHHTSCFTASAAVDWLHQLLRNNSNFGPDVTRQQTVQLLKKFLKNHVIEDVKGRWGTEDLEDNNTLYRFPSTSPLKPIPRAPQASASGSIKKRPSFREKDVFSKFRSSRKHDRETQENVDPALQAEGDDQSAGEKQTQRRELTMQDEREIWKDITLTHLQRILGVASLDEVLDHRYVNPQNIIHNMTKVNKHGVVTLDDKTNDLPHWVLSAMKSLANWPKYDSAQPSYPGFERDVFKTVSDYFYSLPQPLLTYELYELFINVLAPASHQRGKRKKHDLPSVPPPAKASFRSTECLLLSLIRQGTCDETESPMRDVLGGKLQSRIAALRGGGGEGQLGGSCISLSTVVSMRPRTRSCSLETILDDSAPLTRQQLFLSNDSLASCSQSSRSQEDSPVITTPHTPVDFQSVSKTAPGVQTRRRLSVASFRGVSAPQRARPLRPRSVGSCLDIVVETREEDVKETSKLHDRATSCLNVNTPAHLHHSSSSSRSRLLSSYRAPSSSLHSVSSSSSATTKAQGSHPPPAPSGPRPAASTSNLRTLSAPAVVRRCLSSLDLSRQSRPVSLLKKPVCVPASNSQPPQTKPEQSLLQPHCERVAIEALQLCTLLLPPSSRRKLQLLMRMMSRISQNVDMPRLHQAIGTRTLMVHTFSGCVLGSAVECDLDELLATRLVSFLMDHQQSILSVPEYLLSAINDHIQFLRTVQVPVDGVANADPSDPVLAPMPIYAFCHQISGAEFEQQKQESSQKAMEELLEILLTDQSMSEKDRRKKLKQFQKQYPDIYDRRCPPSDSENNKPKIKPPLLNIRKTKAFSIRN
ncbi:DEP domain-containing protein 1A isoform X2 [Halichoeres trimaculatus]|uniref:DEP domain-containing protein 1A isoform X2 n=1 Tax=Halichoeres trimaculatus TaxID=147232 RepID=UPI003D9EF4E8